MNSLNNEIRSNFISWKLKKKVLSVLSKEKGTIYKEHGGRVRVCVVYPNTYSVAMTNLGFHAVYRILNSIDYCVAERAFLPPSEDLEELARTETPLFSFESQTPLKDFDIIAFSLPFEEDYINIPRVLALAGVGVRSTERQTVTPLVIGGGVAVSLNPEPLAGIMDLFLIGEGEGALKPFIDVFRDIKDRNITKEEALKRLDSVDWAYVPSLYDFTYDDFRIKGRTDFGKPSVKAAKRFDLDSFEVPESYIVTPDTEFKDTFLIEVERGCGRGCRFCAAGFLYLPPRWRSAESIKNSVKKGLDETGKVGLVGTAVSEYPDIKDTIQFGVEQGGTVTLSSLRMDKLDTTLLNLLKESGYKTITLAPEAATERMRAVVNKGITDAELMEAIGLITEAGFVKLKLYFIIGLPAEKDEDAQAIVEIAKEIKRIMKRGELALSVNPFIPKPCTPFQWHSFEKEEVVEKRLNIIKKGLAKEHGIVVNAMSAKEAFIQAYIARADRRATDFIIEASKKGWKRALKAIAKLAEDSVYSERQKDEILPWDLIDHGVKKNYLWREYQKGFQGALTPPCDVGRCFRCGVCLPEFFNK